MAKASQVVILAEDSRHQAFLRRFLYDLGYSRHDLRFEPIPSQSREGAGEQWVRENYTRVVAAYRRRASMAKTALVVILDADTKPVANRSTQLAEELRAASLLPRNDTEAIAHIIPKRAIETWLLFLNDRAVNEDDDYRHTRDADELVRPAVVKFLDLLRLGEGRPTNVLESVRLGLKESERIPRP